MGLRTPRAFGSRRREAETGQDQLGDQVGQFVVGWAGSQTLCEGCLDRFLCYLIASDSIMGY